MDRDDWNERYSAAGLLWHAEPNRFLAPEVEGLAPGRALDLACGEGRNAVWLAEQGWDVTAVDFAGVALAKGATMADERGVSVRHVEADVLTWSAPAAAFDLVIVFYLQLPATELQRVLARAVDALAPGGVLLVVAHDRTNLTDGIGGPRDASVLSTPDEVAAALDGLVIERAERVRRPVATDDGTVDAIDLLVRATRGAA